MRRGGSHQSRAAFQGCVSDCASDWLTGLLSVQAGRCRLPSKAHWAPVPQLSCRPHNVCAPRPSRQAGRRSRLCREAAGACLQLSFQMRQGSVLICFSPFGCFFFWLLFSPCCAVLWRAVCSAGRREPGGRLCVHRRRHQQEHAGGGPHACVPAALLCPPGHLSRCSSGVARGVRDRVSRCHPAFFSKLRPRKDRAPCVPVQCILLRSLRLCSLLARACSCLPASPEEVQTMFA